jgi:hypothetical protein
MPYEITKVGIPIRDIDINDQFITAVNHAKAANAVILISSPLEDSPAGSEILKKEFINSSKVLKYNVFDTANDAPNTDPTNFLKQKVVRLLRHLDEQHTILKFDQVYIFSAGSPHLYDIFTHYIPEYRELHIVDAKSSLHVCGEELSKYLQCDGYQIRNFHSDFINRFENVLYPGLSIFGCIDQIYANQNNESIVDQFFNTMMRHTNNNDVFLLASVRSTDVLIKTFDPRNYKQVLAEHPGETFTYGVYKSLEDK